MPAVTNATAHRSGIEPFTLFGEFQTVKSSELEARKREINQLAQDVFNRVDVLDKLIQSQFDQYSKEKALLKGDPEPLLKLKQSILGTIRRRDERLGGLVQALIAYNIALAGDEKLLNSHLINVRKARCKFFDIQKNLAFSDLPDPLQQVVEGRV